MTTEPCASCGEAHPEHAPGSALITCPACRRTTVASGATHIPVLTRSGGASGLDASELVVLSAGFSRRYRLGNVIGCGAVGMVCRATHLDSGREVAIKLLVRPRDTELAQRFLREGRLLARMSHPNVVPVFDMDEVGGHPYLVMELLEGGSLRDAMARTGRFDPERVVRLAEGCLSGLAACHAASTVHRDLKPENILFTRDLDPKIADLGISLAYDQVERLTQTGVVLGTPLYMAPEQLLGDDPTPAADLYAVGTILYELLTGHHPFPAGSLAELHRQVTGTLPAPLRELAPDVPEAVAAAVHHALAKRPEDRPHSALDLAAELSTSTAGGRTSLARRRPGLAPAGARSALPTCAQRQSSPTRRLASSASAAALLLLLALLLRPRSTGVGDAARGPPSIVAEKRVTSIQLLRDRPPPASRALPPPELEAIRTEIERLKRERLGHLDRFEQVLAGFARLESESLPESGWLARKVSRDLGPGLERLGVILVKLRGVCDDLDRTPVPLLMLLARTVAEDLETRIHIDRMTQVADSTAELVAGGRDSFVNIADIGRVHAQVRLGPQNLSRMRDFFQVSLAILDRAARSPALADPTLGAGLADVLWIGNLFKSTGWQPAAGRVFEREATTFQGQVGALGGPAAPAVRKVASGCWLLGRAGIAPSDEALLEATVSAVGELSMQVPHARGSLADLETMLLARGYRLSGAGSSRTEKRPRAGRSSTISR